MASSESALPSNAMPPAANPPESDIITLHVLSPASEVTGGRITFPAISAETTISQLKARLQNSITDSPSPARQRLIYRGRPLVDGTLTLRNLFQAEVSKSVTHTIHALTLLRRPQMTRHQVTPCTWSCLPPNLPPLRLQHHCSLPAFP